MAFAPAAPTVEGMLSTFPAAWLLFALPFVSSAVVANVPALHRLSVRHHRITWPTGLIGLIGLFAGLLGLLSPVYALPVMLAGGAFSGFAVFLPPRTEGGGEDDGGWGRGGPPPEDPPPSPPGDPIDWDYFDRLRLAWERIPAGRH
jgi:hypothetical protein